MEPRRSSRHCRSAAATRALAVVLLAEVVVVVVVVAGGEGAAPSQPFPAYFIFGDSLVDVGNNNYILSIARANNPPFGIDFPEGPTGRFTNGKTAIDILCEYISLPFPPPYLAPTTRGAAILQGVNYASAAGGILQLTGFNFLGRADLDTQIAWFANTIDDLKGQLGESEAEDLIMRSLISITIGANDFVNNYLLILSPTRIQYTPDQFQEILLTKFCQQLTQLYNLGARNIVITSIGPIGCIPSQLARRSVNGECSEYVNNFALNFNEGLKPALSQLNSDLSESNFVYVETFDPVFAYRSNPEQYGFKFGAKACCGAGRFNGFILCLPIFNPCPDRDDYVFWDAYHPTQAANELLGKSIYDSMMSYFGG